MDTLSAIGSAFASGGIWMLSILAVQIVAVAIIIERVVALFVLRSSDQSRLAQELEGDIKKGKLNQALMRAKSIESTAIGAVAEAGIQSAVDLGGRNDIQARMDEILAIENEKLDQRTGYLSMLANVATLLGLLGTIIGLIQSFAAVSSLNPVEKAERLSQGVALAMNATAYGLIVAIPTLVCYAVLQGRAQRLANDLNQGATRVFNWLSYGFDLIPRKKSVKESK